MLVEEGHHRVHQLGEGARLPGKQELVGIYVDHDNQELVRPLNAVITHSFVRGAV